MQQLRGPKLSNFDHLPVCRIADILHTLSLDQPGLSTDHLPLFVHVVIEWYLVRLFSPFLLTYLGAK